MKSLVKHGYRVYTTVSFLTNSGSWSELIEPADTAYVKWTVAQLVSFLAAYKIHGIILVGINIYVSIIGFFFCSETLFQMMICNFESFRRVYLYDTLGIL